jgi:hypothetical protein
MFLGHDPQLGVFISIFKKFIGHGVQFPLSARKEPASQLHSGAGPRYMSSALDVKQTVHVSFKSSILPYPSHERHLGAQFYLSH